MNEGLTVGEFRKNSLCDDVSWGVGYIWSILYSLPLYSNTFTELFWFYLETEMLPHDSKTRNITFWVEETSQVMLTAFSLLAANKSTIIKMLSKWFEIFLTLSKFHISWVDYGGQRIYHLLECLSSGKLKDIYKHCLINPYIKTRREKRRKTQHCHLQVLSEEAARDTKRLWAGLHEAQVSGPVGPTARSPGLWLNSEIQPLRRNQFTVRSDFLRSKFHFLEFLPFIGATHQRRSWNINGNTSGKKYESFTERLLWARPPFRYYFI